MFVCFNTTSEENGVKTIAWDPSFLKTTPGRLKLGAIVSTFPALLKITHFVISYLVMN